MKEDRKTLDLILRKQYKEAKAFVDRITKQDRKLTKRLVGRLGP